MLGLGLGLWSRGASSSAPVSPPSVLMENTGYVLLEDGSKITLE